MGRSSTTGRRHEINYEYYIKGLDKKTRATCVCGKLQTPFRFTFSRAEEDGIDHMGTVPKAGKPLKREEDSVWAESLQL